MNTANRTNNSGQKPGIISEIIFGLILVVVIYIGLLFVEIIYKYINRLSLNRTVVLPNTYNIDDKSIVIPQNPNIKGNM
jgi:hypothetical protein